MRNSLPTVIHELVWGLPEQLAAARKIVPVPEARRPARLRNVVVLGMGGSAIAGDVVRGLLQEVSVIPVFVCRDYHIPRFVTRDSLVVVISYSGDTEETLTAYQEARQRRPALVVVTSGGKLARQAKRNRHPMVTVPQGLPPRAALGYLFVPLVGILSRLRVCPSFAPALSETIDLLTRRRRVWLRQASRIARLLVDRLPLVYSTSRLLDVVAERWRCQLNENAKVMCHTSFLPEQNHNEIVGMGAPRFLARRSILIALLDRKTSRRNRLRLRHLIAITRNSYERVLILKSAGRSPLARLFSLLMLGDLVSCELARLRGVDPLPIARITELKHRLAQER